MAKQHGIIKINGRLGDMSFQKSAGKWIVKEIDPSLSERVKTSPNYLNTRLNGRDFGHCMAVAKDIYDAILGKRQTMYLRTNYPLGRVQKALLARMRDHEEELGFRGLTGLDMEAIIPQINALAKRPFESTYFTPQIYVTPTNMVLAPIDYSQARAAAQAVGADFLKVEVSRTKTIGGIAVDAAGEAHRTWDVAPGAFNIHTSNTRLWPTPVVDEDGELTWEDPQAIQNNIFGVVEYDLTKGSYYEVKVIPCKIESIGAGRYTYSELISDASFMVFGAIPEATTMHINLNTNIPTLPVAGGKFRANYSLSTGSPHQSGQVDTIDDVKSWFDGETPDYDSTFDVNVMYEVTDSEGELVSYEGKKTINGKSVPLAEFLTDAPSYLDVTITDWVLVD